MRNFIRRYVKPSYWLENEGSDKSEEFAVKIAVWQFWTDDLDCMFSEWMFLIWRQRIYVPQSWHHNLLLNTNHSWLI
jgi:hypothetical protein